LREIIEHPLSFAKLGLSLLSFQLGMLEPQRQLLSLLELLGKVHKVLLLLGLGDVGWQVLKLLKINVWVECLLEVWCFVFLAKMHLLFKVVFTVVERLESQVVGVELASLVFGATLHVFYHLIDSSLASTDCKESFFVLVV
jgi:hypothetical protein